MKKSITNLFQKVKEKAVSAYAVVKKNALGILASVTAMIPASSTMVTYALNTSNIKDDKLLENVLEIIFKIFTYIGILLLAWSIGMLVLAFKNEDADSKSRAMMMMVVSIVLIGIKTIFKMTGII